MTRTPVHLDSVPIPMPPEVRQGLADIYLDVEREIEDRRMTCDACGQCCNLASWGHELWLTQLELALLIENHGHRRPKEEGVCPYLDKEGLCTAHPNRALGCRVFSCHGKKSVIEDLHERAFQKIRNLAKKHNIDLQYGELLTSLKKSKT